MHPLRNINKTGRSVGEKWHISWNLETGQDMTSWSTWKHPLRLEQEHEQIQYMHPACSTTWQELQINPNN